MKKCENLIQWFVFRLICNFDHISLQFGQSLIISNGKMDLRKPKRVFHLFEKEIEFVFIVVRNSVYFR